jgi:uncharacterized membrane protein
VKSRDWQTLKVLTGLALIAVYAILSHYCNTGGHRALGAALALAPFLILAASFLWRSQRPVAAAALGLAAGIALYESWPRLKDHFSLIYFLQESAMYGLLAAGFARSLRAGDTPLCTRLADRLHGPLTAAESRYTRQVTLAWALLLGAITVATLALFLLAPLAVWSAFDNLVAVPLIAAGFVAEHFIRRRVLPKADRGGILATVRVFLASR